MDKGASSGQCSMHGQVLGRAGWAGTHRPAQHISLLSLPAAMRNAVPAPQEGLAAAVLAAACWPASRPKPEPSRPCPSGSHSLAFFLPPHSHSPAPTPTLHSSPFFSDFPASLCVSSRLRSSLLEKNKTEASSIPLYCDSARSPLRVGPLDSKKHPHPVPG